MLENEFLIWGNEFLILENQTIFSVIRKWISSTSQSAKVEFNAYFLILEIHFLILEIHFLILEIQFLKLEKNF